MIFSFANKLISCPIVLLSLFSFSFSYSGYATDNLDVAFGDPAIHEEPNFDPIKDAKGFRAAMKGFGTDERKITNIVTTRTFEQRQKIISSYEKTIKRNLLNDLKGEISGDFGKVVLNLFKAPYEYLATELYEALNSILKDTDALVEILCSHGSEDIFQVNDQFQRLYNKPLSVLMEKRLSGEFGSFMNNLVTIKRRTEVPALSNFTQVLSKIYYKGTLGARKLDEGLLVDIFTKLSFAQVSTFAKEYEIKFKTSLESDIKAKIWNPLQKALLAVLNVAENRPKYFANCLMQAFKSRIREDGVIIRIFVSRSELDLKTIAEEYEKVAGQSLEAVINDKLSSSEYKRALLSFISSY